jgi:hypothetical protein
MVMNKEIAHLTDQVIYEAMLAERPNLVGGIALLLESGQTPGQIKAEMKRRFGDIQMVRNVRHVAEHLAATN